MKKIVKLIPLLILACFASTPAYADTGLPMIFVTLPNMIIALLPVIIIEAFVLRKKITIPIKRIMKISSVANGVSTIAGIPVTWLILVVLQMITGGGGAHGLQTTLQKFLAITWQAPWLIPYESAFYWMVPSATLVLLVPFFFASYFIEYLIAKKMLKEYDRKKIRESVFVANLTTYIILGLITVGWLAISLILHTKTL